MKYYISSSILFVLLLLVSSTWAFAAKKKGGKATKRTASTNKGFGVAPLTLEETLASFKTRFPPNADNQPCPCQSGNVYKDCCGPYHKEGQAALPPTPLAVLRSRYAAFCFRTIKYIIESTHSTCRDYQEDRIAWAKSLDKNGMFDSYEFVNLNVIEIAEGEDQAFIDFQVKLRSNANGEETIVAETSHFLKENGRWTYASGNVRSMVEGVDDIILNQ